MPLRQLQIIAAEFLFRMARYRWPALALAWAVALAGWLVVASLPDEYRAQARVYVDTRSILMPLLGNLTVMPDTTAQVQIISDILRSRPRLEAVMVQTGLDRRAGNLVEMEELLQELARNVGIVRERQVDLFTITYQDRDPAMARDVVQALLAAFMDSATGRDRADALEAQRFLEQQIAQTEQRLVAAEERRAAFRRANAGLLPGEGGDYFTRLRATEDQVRQLRAQIQAQAERRGELMRQAGLTAGGAAADGEADALPALPTSVDADIQRLEQELVGLRAQFTERHPRVVAAAATLDSLYAVRDKERSQAAEQAAQGTDTLATSRDISPLMLQLRVALSEADVELAALRSALREREQAMGALAAMVTVMPDIEAQLGRLDRDYGVIRTQYDQLVQRLEAARIGEEAQVGTEAVRFDVIDPPRLPVTPAGPNRPLLYAGALVLALAAGAGLAFLLSLSHPVFFVAQRLGTHAGLPVFGKVSRTGGHLYSSADLLLLSTAAVALLLACLGLASGYLGLLLDLRSLF